MTARLVGFERNTTPRDLASDRSEYIRAEAERRSEGPYDGDEIDCHLDSLRDKQTLKLIAHALNTNDALPLLQLMQKAFEPRRQDYHESEVERELGL
jgi:hypothetical protein